MTSRHLWLVAICAVALFTLPACSKTPKTACENILGIDEKEATKANITACYAEFFSPMRGAGAGKVDEAPHIACYNAASTKEDVGACFTAVMKVAIDLPGSDAHKAAAAAVADEARRARDGAKAVALEDCVSTCSAQVGDYTDPKYSECLTACKRAAGI